MSEPFAFLEAEFDEVYEAARKAASGAIVDPRTSCFYARRALELAVEWAFRHDAALVLPYDTNLSAMVNSPSFKGVAGENMYLLAKEIIRAGNAAVHRNQPIRPVDSVNAVSKLFHVSYWFARTYAKVKPEPGLKFDPNLLPRTAVPQQTVEQLEALQADLEERDRRVAELAANNAALDAELARLRAEVAAAKLAAAAVPDTHDYSEAETRDFFIDLLLAEAGWTLTDKRDREFPVTGMPDGDGLVDYVLWGTDGKPLALIEAKRTKRDPRAGQHQAKLYADCLEAMFGQRPVIFYSNGYEHHIWDDQMYPPRAVQGFYKRDELELLIQRRTTRKPLTTGEINSDIVERYYQTRSIVRTAEAFERDKERKALVVMATGAGKTRTVIALSDLLIRCNWAKRILFLADRTALVKQAVGAFKAFLPDSSPVNLVTERNAEGRVYVSTYPTMMGLIGDGGGGERRFGVGHFDLIVIDEAHRSVFQKYKAIFDYFDSLLVGLTATPREEIDRNTYSLFDLETGVPTDAYSLAEAVSDGFLVPPKAISVPTKFQREGITYADLSEDEKDQWDELDWDEDGDTPEAISPAALNQWLFNAHTVDLVLETLMTRGLKVAGGDRLGKTIIFAKNQQHARFIVDRFDINYPHHRGEFAKVITSEVEHNDDLIAKFSIKDANPHIAISVDMLDTGIDVPEVVNLVFFKMVCSKTKFWQMLGRGTRLCPDLFAPGEDKEFFYVFDFCQNLEYFNQDLPPSDGAIGDSLSTRLFKARLELVAHLDAHGGYRDLRDSIAATLREQVASMNVDNFVVRPKRAIVERYASAAAWDGLSTETLTALATEVAGLPTQLDAEREEPKRFDALILNLQLAVLRADPTFTRLRDQVKTIAAALEEYTTIPMVAAEIELIQAIQSEEWWQDVTVAMLESARRRLRGLVAFIEKSKRKIVYSNFEDQLGDATNIELGIFASTGFEQFRKKARAFLQEHRGESAIKKIHMGWPVTPDDIAELERILLDAGIATSMDLARALEEAGSLGLFIRSLVGLDRSAAKAAFASFLDATQFNANQIEFINLVIDELAANGTIAPSRFYESPYTDLSAVGPDGLFTSAQIDEMMSVLYRVTALVA